MWVAIQILYWRTKCLSYKLKSHIEGTSAWVEPQKEIRTSPYLLNVLLQPERNQRSNLDHPSLFVYYHCNIVSSYLKVGSSTHVSFMDNCSTTASGITPQSAHKPPPRCSETFTSIGTTQCRFNWLTIPTHQLRASAQSGNTKDFFFGLVFQVLTMHSKRTGARRGIQSSKTK